MKNLAASVKPVTLGSGSPAATQQTRKTCRRTIHQQNTGSRDADSINGAEDAETLASIIIEDEASRLICVEGDKWWYDQGRMIIIENMGENKSKAPKKMVSIKDEPEIINGSKKKKNGVMERRSDGELRPLRSILKVGSNLSKSSTQVDNNNPMRKATMDYSSIIHK
ncbi:hypothetical protein SOVF_109400 [Spinacia oleracea]|nr:hypothetical protein SOVF_109400 [Spinacia oleracea]